MFAWITLFIFILDETEMAQNNPVLVFVCQTSNDNHGRLNLRIGMNQVTNLKLLGFTWNKKQIYWEPPQVFDPHIPAIAQFVVDGVAKLVFNLFICISCCRSR